LGVAFIEKIHHRSLLGLLAQSAGTMLTQTIVVSELGCSLGNRRATWLTSCRAAWLDSGQAADLRRACGLQASGLSARVRTPGDLPRAILCRVALAPLLSGAPF
jgi:hypothetical protein